MKTCDGCGIEFTDDVELYPRLVFTQEVKVARKLAEKEGEEQLCLNCFLESVEELEKKHLAMALLGLLRKIRSLESRLSGRQDLDSFRKFKEEIEKSTKQWPPVTVTPYVYPQVVPYVSPNTGDTIPIPTWTTSDTPPPSVRCHDSSLMNAPVTNTVYVTGTWGKLLGK